MADVAIPQRPREAQSGSSSHIRAAELEALLNRFKAEHGRCVVLHGPRGAGKRDLAAALKREVQREPGAVVLEGHTLGAGSGSFQPFSEIARQAMGWAAQSDATEALIDPNLDALALVLEHPEGLERDTAPSLEQKLRFFEAMRCLLTGMAERARILVVLHDLDRADPDTLELATYLADNLFGDPVLDADARRPGLLALLVRDGDSTHNRVRDFLARSEESRAVDTMPLRGLDLEGLRRYVQTSPALERLFEATHGLPSQIDELIDALPTNVEELFERKLEQLEASQRGLLQALSIFERPTPARLLASAVERPLPEVARELSALRDQRILTRHITHGDIRFAFTRRSNLDVTVRATATEQRARLHAGWARALTELPGHGGAALLAHHQLRSNEPTRGVPLAVRAAESHTVAGAFEASTRLLEDALPHAKGDLRTTILERLFELARLRAAPREALRYLREWSDTLPEGEEGRAQLREAELINAAGDHARALEFIEQARASLQDAPMSDRVALEVAASEAHYQLGDLEQAATVGRTGLELLDTSDEPLPVRQRIELLNLLGKIALASDQCGTALELFDENLRLARRGQLPREEARALVNLGVAHFRNGARQDAESWLRAGITKAQEHNDLARLAFGNLNLGVLAHQQGDLGRAIACYRECRSLFSRLGNRTQLARVLHNLGNLYFITGDLARARAHNDEALRLATDGGVEKVVALATTLDGLLLAEAGDKSAGEARLREAMVLHRRLGAERPIETMVELAALQIDGGDEDHALSTLDELKSALDELDNQQLAARAALLRGRVLLAKDDPSAQAELTKVRGAIEALGERLLLRDAELAVGIAHMRRGHEETARMHLGAAIAVQEAMAQELPAELRETFEAARPQRAAPRALARLEGRPVEPNEDETPSASPAVKDHVTAPRDPEWARRYGRIIGRSAKLNRVFKILDRVSTSEDTVLIVGESGTGKELVAEAIHRNSPRSSGPFVKLNCAALVESLLLSELFGHERGSFTGAHQRKVGRFEMAASGTIFLDEIGDISPQTQVALLRVLQEFEFERVGGGRSIKLEARVICATNRNLAQMVRDGTFREDLYYRLKGLTVELPPLRERAGDVGDLAQHFLNRYAEESGADIKTIATPALVALSQYRWPGNVRELENVVRSVALFADGREIQRSDFEEYRELFEDSPSLTKALGESRVSAPSLAAPPATVRIPSPPPDATQVDTGPTPTVAAVNRDAKSVLMEEIFERGVSLADLKRKLQDDAIAHALKTTRGNITRAAEMLGMKRPRLSQIINANEALKELCQGASR